MIISFKKKFAIFFAFYILVMSLHLPLYKAYADEISNSEQVRLNTIEFYNNMQDEDVLINPTNVNNRSIGALATLVPIAVPGLVKILQVFMLSLVAIDSWDSGFVGAVYNMITNLNVGQMYNDITSFLEKKFDDVQSATLAFLVAYDNFSTSTGKIVDNVRTKLLKFYKEEFIVSLEENLAKGVDVATLALYGVTDFFKKDIFQDFYDNVPTITSFPMLKIGSKGLTNQGIGSSYSFRYLNFNANDPKQTYGLYNIAAGHDLNMSFVDKVQITRSNVQQYNYGWDGLHWTQQYYMKQAKDGLMYMIVFSIGKALSPNQKTDYKHDGLSFGLYQVNELGEVVKGNANNVYYRTADNRLNNLVPSIGTNLYKGSSIGVDFGKLRDICVDLWGADVFPNVPDVWNLGFDCVSESNRLVDYSKNEPGVYDNAWNYKGNPIFPVPGDDTEIKFPTLKPGQGVDVYNPQIPGATWGDLFPPSTYPNGGTITTPGDFVGNPSIPGDDILNPDIPDVDNPDIDVPDVPDVDVPGTPSISWDWLKTLLGSILALIQKIIDWLDNFWVNLWEFLKSLLIPGDTYFVDVFNDITIALKEKIPGIDITKLEELAVGDLAFKDIYANFFGVECLVVRGSVINRVISWARPIIQGLIALFLLLYNYNQIYFLIRGSSLLGATNTIDNMNNNRIGGRK